MRREDLSPPYVILKEKQVWSDWLYDAPPGTKMNVSSSGWIDHDVFNDWFKNHFLPLANKNEGKKILICDNLSAHISLESLKLCEEHNISFICLIPNSTHLLQPLDVSYFASLKTHWREVLLEWRQTKDGKRCVSLPKSIFSQLLKKALVRGENTALQNLKKGFSSTGIYPLNCQHVIDKLPAYAKQQNEVAEQVGKEFCHYFDQVRNTDLKLVPKPRKYLLPVEPGKSISAEEVAEYYAQREAASTSRGGPRTRGGIRKRGGGIRTRGGASNGRSVKAGREIGSEEGTPMSEEGKVALEEINLEEMIELNDLCGDLPVPDDMFENEDEAIQFLSQEILNIPTDITVGDFVIVEYEGELFPGQITEISANEDEGPMYKVYCMSRSGPHWKWSLPRDKMFYNKNDVLRKVGAEAIIPVSNRGVFRVADSFLESRWNNGLCEEK